jgi:hypothetical protein
MQLSPTASLIGPVGPVPTPGPIGVGSLGTMRIGHALNGISYTEHKLLAPLTAPFGHYTGSLQDAIISATAAIRDFETRADGRIAVALLMDGTGWSARTVLADSMILRAIDNGPGTGGIASISFPTVSRSLAALVTSEGSLLPSKLR